MTDSTLSPSVDPSALALLPPAELTTIELVAWQVMLPSGSDGRPIAPDGEPWIITHRVDGRAPSMHALGDAPLRSLFRGSRVVAEFGSTPPPEYDIVFAFIERPLALFASASSPTLRDQDLEKLFTELRRRPDGRYQSPLYRYVQAVLRSLLMLRPTSESEFDALLRRLARSARTFSVGASSTNYVEHVLGPLLRL